MLPPTYLTCLEVGQYADPAAVLEAAQGRTGRDVHPAVEEHDDGRHALGARPSCARCSPPEHG